VPAEDLLVALEPPRGLSARNLVRVRIAALERLGPDVLLRAGRTDADERWLARLTPAAVKDLGLAVERDVWLAIKSHSIRWLG
jgi:molybdate transport system ATP-binding protein